jgi:hypothetical protein
MLLYHGTSERVARKALTEGLWPRALSRAPSLWERTVPSNSQLVYLTASYPGYFAANAAEEGEKWAIIEVDTDLLDEDDLRPDEDAMEQGSRELGETGFEELDALPLGAMKERTLWFRDNIELFRHLWEKSLEMLGTVGYCGVISPEAITRVGIYDPKSSPGVSMAVIDTMVCLMNHRFLFERHQRMVAVLMGDSTDPGALLMHPSMREVMGEEAFSRVRKSVEAVRVEVLINTQPPAAGSCGTT